MNVFQVLLFTTEFMLALQRLLAALHWQLRISKTPKNPVGITGPLIIKPLHYCCSSAETCCNHQSSHDIYVAAALGCLNGLIFFL